MVYDKIPSDPCVVIGQNFYSHNDNNDNRARLYTPIVGTRPEEYTSRACLNTAIIIIHIPRGHLLTRNSTGKTKGRLHEEHGKFYSKYISFSTVKNGNDDHDGKVHTDGKKKTVYYRVMVII